VHLERGRRGEKLAVGHLKKQGYKILDTNLRTRMGEVDVLAQAPDGRTIVMVEVKTGSGGPISPETRVGKDKQRKLAALAGLIARKRNLTGRPIRFDIIGVDLPTKGKPTIRHHRCAFESPW